MLQVQYIKLNGLAREPRNAYGNDAGWDLFVMGSTIIEPGSFVDVRSGVAAAIPEGYYGRIIGRSSTIRSRGLIVMEGIIDAGFRGELFAGVYNPGQTRVTVHHGDSLAQIIIQLVPEIQWIQIRELPPSDRGTQGFGSSGS